MRVVFMGTPEFAVPCLQKLIDCGHEVTGVFTQPDKPQGRKMILTPPPVKTLALENGIKVYQPTKMRDGTALEMLREAAPELVIVVAYGKILPKEILDYPKYGCINIHASLLPHLRGAAPIQWSVINGFAKTGVTSMQMDEGLDTGDIIEMRKFPIESEDDFEAIHDRSAEIGSVLLSSILPKMKPQVSFTTGFQRSVRMFLKKPLTLCSRVSLYPKSRITTNLPMRLCFQRNCHRLTGI